MSPKKISESCKKYLCERCGKTFTQYHSPKEHQKYACKYLETQHREKENCPKCNKQISLATMYNHLKYQENFFVFWKYGCPKPKRKCIKVSSVFADLCASASTGRDLSILKYETQEDLNALLFKPPLALPSIIIKSEKKVPISFLIICKKIKKQKFIIVLFLCVCHIICWWHIRMKSDLFQTRYKNVLGKSFRNFLVSQKS